MMDDDEWWYWKKKQDLEEWRRQQEEDDFWSRQEYTPSSDDGSSDDNGWGCLFVLIVLVAAYVFGWKDSADKEEQKAPQIERGELVEESVVDEYLTLEQLYFSSYVAFGVEQID